MSPEPTQTDASACAIPDALAPDVSFEQARDAYSQRKFWISFFVRPCCPPPSGELAVKALEDQRDLVRARDDFSDEEKDELIKLIDEGEAWYRTTPYWAKGAH